MNTNLKKLLLILIVSGFACLANAQTTTSTPSAIPGGVRFSVGVDAGLPTSDLSDSYGWSLGGSLQADIPIVPSQLVVTINAGYNNIFGKKIILASQALGVYTSATGVPPSINLLPVKAGLKFFLAPHFYIQGEAGADIVLDKTKIYATNSAVFAYAPQVGYQFPLASDHSLDVGLRYEASGMLSSDDYTSKVTLFGLRIAYGF